ncbi:MAG: hypothetical protein K9H16_07130 [Bacteroidales bacterium]|nr:hypothetical protein [Bacteroidales bacterium]
MSYNEIEELRKSGNLEQAYVLAVADLQDAIQDVAIPELLPELNEEIATKESIIMLGKRALSWVLYDFLKQNTDAENFDTFIYYLKEFVEIDLDPSEKMVVNQLVWVIGKAAFEFTKEPDFDISRMEELLEATMKLKFSKQTKGYSFLFKAFHKALKESPQYIEFASWWDLWSFIRDDYKYTKQDDGKKIMAVAEQGFNRYAKHLVFALENNPDEITEASLHQKVTDFLPVVETAMQHNKHYNKLPYYHIKLLFALGDFQKGFSLLKKQARQNQNEFWVWQLMGEVYSENKEKQLACWCTSMLCHTNLENIIQMRVKIAGKLIGKGQYDDAKTEIALILKSCLENKWNFPEEVANWGDEPWYGLAKVNKNNLSLYESYQQVADDILFGDIPERKIVVESVNTPKKILNFLGTDFIKGYFKYDKILKNVREGDILVVRIQDAGLEGRFNVFSAIKLKMKYLDGILKPFSGEVIKHAAKNFAFADGMFIPPELCTKARLKDGEYIAGKAMISYNKKKEEWGWKAISID